MAPKRRITLFHAPNTRSSGAAILVEELGADYEIKLLNMKANEQRGPAFLAINPMGKVPAVMHGEVLITEQVAIYLYLTDLYPEAGLAPPVGDPQRGPYLRWMVFYGSCFEPAVIDRAMKRDPGPKLMSPYGDFDTMLAALLGQLGKGPYMLGSQFTSVDILWGTALRWMVNLKLVPDHPAITAYVKRIAARPIVIRVTALESERAARLPG
jgi:glutathione S-transferase